MYALADCNNFYCSCERVFQPGLMDRPVIVLSNNDGCVIARSNEVKKLGIKMGEPYFKIKDLIRKHRIAVRSSNYTLYGDMSQRVLRTLESFSPEVENYSIDESFLNLSGFTTDLTAYARLIRSTMLQHTGIPVSIGIAPTKTLAKVANKLAKRSPAGVLLLADMPGQTEALRELEVGDVWGVGPRYAKMLNQYGITTALDLRDADLEWVRRRMTVVGLRTVLELQGQPCIPLELEPQASRQIVRSRSFGQPVTLLAELEQAIAMHASRAAEKLRFQGLAANQMSVFIATNYFIPADPQYTNNSMIRLPMATNDTATLIECGLAGLRRIYREGYRYKKGGVMLADLVPADRVQGHLFLECDPEKQARINRALDEINRRFGSFSLRHAAMGINQRWAMRREHCSPCYTTRWNDLPLAKA